MSTPRTDVSEPTRRQIPTEVPLETFVGRCQELDALGVRYSVGIVGKREHRADADRLRRALLDSVYLWVNAYKSEGAGYYQGDEAAAFTAIDPLFPLNDTQHASLGFACAAGHRAFTVDGVGDVRRCHFIGARLGNLYTDPLEAMLAPRACTNERCGCYIGYVHLERLGLRDVYGDGLMERIPRRWG